MSSPVATRYLPIEVIVESRSNPRKTFDPDEMKELAENIKAHGIIQPILVRPLSTGQMQIVDGARRFRAAGEAGLTEIPSIIRDYSDDQVVEVQLISFLHDAGISPLEEAAVYEQLQKKKFDIAQISSKVGKSRSYIAKRLQLVTLIEPAKKQLRDGRITLGHAIEIARLQPDAQKVAMDELFYNPGTASDLRNWIKDELMPPLSSGSFKKDDATLIPKAGPCTTCPKRSSSNLDLFGDLAKKHDHCLDHECFNAKVAAFHELNKAKKEESAEADVKAPVSMARRQELYKRRCEIHENRVEQEARLRQFKSLLLRLKWPVERKDFDIILLELMHRSRFDSERIAEAIGLKDLPDLGYDDELEMKKLSKLSDQQTAQAALGIVLDQELIFDPLSSIPEDARFTALCSRHGINRAKIRAEVAKEMEPRKPQPPKDEPKKKKAPRAAAAIKTKTKKRLKK